MWSWQTQNRTQTSQFAHALAEVLNPGTTVGLIGPLGSGKTTLVQEVVRHLGLAPENVTSPTFVLIHEYPTQPPVYHMDAYRIGSLEEFYELGVEEYFASSGLVFVEWADRVWPAMPPDCLRIEIQVLGDTQREFRLEGQGQCHKYESALKHRMNHSLASG